MTIDNSPQTDIHITTAANYIIARRLQVPAIFFLELHRNLSALSHATLTVFSPMLSVFCGASKVELLLSILEDKKSVDKLIAEIEKSTSNPKLDNT